MLTKQDLQAIGSLIEVHLETKLEEKLESKLDEKLSPIHTDIKQIKKDVKKLRRDLDSTISYFDNRDNSLKGAINKTRRELNLQDFEFV